MKFVFLFLSVIIFSSNLFSQTEYSSRLKAKLNSSSTSEYIRVLCLFKDRVDIESLDERLYLENSSLQKRALEVITRLQEKATTTQRDLKQFLSNKIITNEVKNFESFWITNLIMVEATKSIIDQLLLRKDIEFIDLDALLSYDKPIFNSYDQSKYMSSEIGLRVCNAHKLWQLGYTGAGRIVMGIDTGVDGNHPALNSRWRGTHVPSSQAWFDPVNQTVFPSDCDNHGTHTMGIMCGRSSTTFDTVGMAPDAEWIAAKTICTSPHTSNSIAAFQWAMNPDGNPNTISDMPDAINNSWYDPNVTSTQCSGIYKTTLDALEAAGIAIVFSAGNNGPNASTITAPKNINTDLVNSFCVANINATVVGYPIANSSSRGPSTCGGSGSLLIKPEVSAPGTSVRSSVIGTGYATMSGTSMASPHVVGAIALLKQRFPYLTGRQIKLALYNTAIDLGTDGEDNTYGKGLIDVYAAYLYLTNLDSVSTFSVNSGWNLVSIPLLSSYKTKDQLFPSSISNAYFYSGNYVIKDTLETGYGYWLKFLSAGSQSVSGTIITEYNVPISAGWNIIGSLNDSINISSIITVPPNILISNFYTYDGVYTIPASITKGKGYWVKSSSVGIIKLQKSFTKQTVSSNILPEWNNLFFEDRDNRSTSLFLAEKFDKAIELPPTPPSGAFDIRFSNDQLVSEKNNTNIVQLNSVVYPLTIKLKNSTNEKYLIEDNINGKIFSETLTKDNDVIIKNSDIKSFKLSLIKQNLEYSLYQNYPNPFNPKTIINFSLPQKNKVRLAVYNFLGELVKVLINKEMESGIHQIEFNGSEYSSGVYLYKLDAGSFSESKKLILIK